MMKRLILLLTILLTAVNIFTFPQTAYAAAEPPQVTATTAVLIDADTGKVLYNKQMDQKMYPASTTKMMTAILAIEKLDLNKKMVIDAETPFTEGARIYLEEGEEILTMDVLKAMMIASANDSAVALGKAIAGDIPAFAEMMNAKAAEIGAKNTHFTNPNGLPDEQHTTTAYDLALIAKYAMKNQTFRDIVKTYQYNIPANNKKEERHLYNTNRLIYDEKTNVTVNGVQRPAKYEGATGIKTGQTDEAGACLVAGAKRGDTELISVVLQSPDGGRFADSIALLDYGFDNFKSIKALEKGKKVGTVKVKNGAVGTVNAVLAKDAHVSLPKEASAEILNTKPLLDEKIEAPIAKGQKIGIVKIYEDDQLVGQVDAIAANNVEVGGFLSHLGVGDKAAGKIGMVLKAGVILIIILLMIYVSVKRRQVKQRKRRRLAEAEKRRRQKEDEWNRWSTEYDRRENPYNYHSSYNRKR